jgi:hypothetical protein
MNLDDVVCEVDRAVSGLCLMVDFDKVMNLL